MIQNDSGCLRRTKATTNSVKYISWEGLDFLRIRKVSSTLKTVHEYDSQTNKLLRTIEKSKIDETSDTQILALTEITLDELQKHRTSKVPSFVLKVGDKFYYTKIPNEMSLLGAKFDGVHKCANPFNSCKRLSSASDAKGGCAKIRNGSSHIELYPWITLGYETFGTKHNAFVVAQCSHYAGNATQNAIPAKNSSKSTSDIVKYMFEPHEVIKSTLPKKSPKGKIY